MSTLFVCAMGLVAFVIFGGICEAVATLLGLMDPWDLR